LCRFRSGRYERIYVHRQIKVSDLEKNVALNDRRMGAGLILTPREVAFARRDSWIKGDAKMKRRGFLKRKKACWRCVFTAEVNR